MYHGYLFIYAFQPIPVLRCRYPSSPYNISTLISDFLNKIMGIIHHLSVSKIRHELHFNLLELNLHHNQFCSIECSPSNLRIQ